MNLAQRIQNQRKMKGLSQEELAEIVGVSRQAVSKWESEQSTPDLEKIIIISDYFGVTSDYLLKGVESKKNLGIKFDSFTTLVLASALYYIGIILSYGLWSLRQRDIDGIIGLIFIILGTVIFFIGYHNSKDTNKEKNKKRLIQINAWIVVFFICSLFFNLLWYQQLIPFPDFADPYFFYRWAIFILTYVASLFLIYKNIDKLIK